MALLIRSAPFKGGQLVWFIAIIRDASRYIVINKADFMRQPEDGRTLDLLEAAGVIKRGRGRPRLEHALSDKERAKRYRDNKRKRLAAEGGKKASASAFLPNREAELSEEITRLRKERELLRNDLAAMSAIAEDLIAARRTHKRIPSDVFKNLTQSHLKITLRHDFI